ncbi:MAG: GMP/IMP nucleotidase YrfG [bacterium ADurb.Bin429]|nr:MAG: GMP/IMP nucleotidase YrfG [bacterium ADurb.Bin429]
MQYLIWDFDGTLGYRDGGMWSGTLREILRDERPEIDAPIEVLREYVGRGYPWHMPEAPHCHLDTAEKWWEALMPVLARALAGVGVPEAEAAVLARQFPARYTELSRWRLFSDTLPALSALSAVGWRHVLLTNHVPELPRIVAHLGLDAHLSAVFNSAQTGYEKPHPRAFHNVLDFIGPAEAVWMIGDNPKADVAGAEAAGIPAILVRTMGVDVRYRCEELAGVAEIIASAPASR